MLFLNFFFIKFFCENVKRVVADSGVNLLFALVSGELHKDGKVGVS